MVLLKRNGAMMIENINDKYIKFKCSFTSEDGLYTWVQGLKYGLIGKDERFYYIYRHNLDPYRLSKESEGKAYEICDNQYDNKR